MIYNEYQACYVEGKFETRLRLYLKHFDFVETIGLNLTAFLALCNVSPRSGVTNLVGRRESSPVWLNSRKPKYNGNLP